MSAFYSLFIVILVSLRFFFSFGLSSIFDALQPYLLRDFSILPTTMGWLSGVFFYAEAALIIPAGLILDRISPRKLASLALLLSVVGLVMMANAQSLAMLIFSRFIMGIGAGLQFSGCVRVIVNWLKADLFGRGMAILTTMGIVGGMMAQAPFTYLIGIVGWRHAIYVLVLLGMLIIAVAYFCVPDHPKGFQLHVRAKEANALGFLKRFKMAFLRKQNVLCGVYVGLMNLPLFMLGALWGITYLTHVNGVSELQAASISSMIFLGCIIGFPIAGAFSDYIKKRVWPMKLGALVSFILVMAMIYFKTTHFSLLMLSYFLLGLLTSTQVIAFPTVLESNSRGISGGASSVISIISILSGALSQPLFGSIVAHLGFEVAMWILPLAFIVAFGVSYGIKETYCRSLD